METETEIAVEAAKEEAWGIMGKIAIELRKVVGGDGKSPFGEERAATIYELATRFNRLRELLDEYDHAILRALG